MKFSAPFPWNEKAIDSFCELFATVDSIEVEWFWEPFLRPGIEAAEFAAQKGLTESEFVSVVSELSCPAAPQKFLTRWHQLGICDEDGRVLALDPTRTLLQTFEMLKSSDHNTIDRSEQHGEMHIDRSEESGPRKRTAYLGGACLGVIDLQQKLGPNVARGWRPSENQPEVLLLSSWLTPHSSLMKRFQALDPWAKLELVECLIGVTKPSSNLQFERIPKF